MYGEHNENIGEFSGRPGLILQNNYSLTLFGSSYNNVSTQNRDTYLSQFVRILIMYPQLFSLLSPTLF